MENWTWENIMTVRALTPLAILYFIFFWGIPMLGSINHKKLPENRILSYWTAVRQISGLFHIAAIVAGIIVWLLYPYMVIS